MGRPKAFLPFREGTFLSTLAGTFGAFCSPVIVVFGFEGEAAARRAPEQVTAVFNRDYQKGMLTSLQAGLRMVDWNRVERVIFTLVDHPAISPETIRSLLNTGDPIVIPRIGGERGHPVLIRRNICEAFLNEPATSKVRDVIDRHAADIRYLDVDDPGIRDDVDDSALYAALLTREASRGPGDPA